MYSLLGDVVTTWKAFFQGLNTGEYAVSEVLGSVFNILSIVLWVVLGITGAAGAIYAIYLGVKLARADEQGKRDEAKKHLITVAIAVGVTVVLILFFNTFLPMILSAVGLNESQWGDVGGNQVTPPGPGGQGQGETVL